jgi:hypothetical protein
MNRASWLKIISLALSLTLFAAQGFSQQISNPTRKKTVDDFLSTWLVSKDKAAALKFFHRRAFLSEDVLSVPCFGGYVSDEDSQNPAAVRRAVLRFLEDSSERIKGSSLSDILFLTSSDVPELSQKAETAFQKVALNVPRRDKYYLVGYKSFVSAFPGGRYREYFARRYNLRDAFFSVVQYRVLNEDERYGDDVFMILMWVRDKAAWRIVNVAVACN